MPESAGNSCLASESFSLTLSCAHSLAPGEEWSAYVAFRSEGSGFADFAEGEDGDVTQVDLIEDRLSVQAACKWLLANDNYALSGDFRDAIEIEGVSEGLDLLALAWLRDWEYASEAGWLLAQPTNAIDVLRRALGPVDHEDVLSALREYCSEFEEGLLASHIADLENVRTREEGLSLLLRWSASAAEERESVAHQVVIQRKKALAPFESEIEHLVTGVLGPVQKASNWASGLAEQRRRSALRMTIERFAIQSGRLPSEVELSRIVPTIDSQIESL